MRWAFRSIAWNSAVPLATWKWFGRWPEVVRDHGARLVFFFQAEDGIRDYKVTGVQTCALPIYRLARRLPVQWKSVKDTGRDSEKKRTLEEFIPLSRTFVSALSSQQSQEFAWVVVESGEDRVEPFHTEVLGENLADYGAEVRGER